MNDKEIVEKLFMTYKNSWLEAVNQNLVLKVQMDSMNETIGKNNIKIDELNKQIEELKGHIHNIKTARVQQQAPKTENK